MRKLEYICGDKPVLVRDVLKEKLKLSKGTIVSLKERKGIFVNGELVTVRKEMEKGDVLSLEIKDGKEKNIVAVKMDIHILYEDEDILAVDKPSGIATHPSINHYTDTLANGIMFMYKDTDFVFRASNRLDRETSGIVLIAKNRYASHKLGEQMKNGLICKTYYAMCEGNFEVKKGEICAPIARKEESIIFRHVSDEGKYCLTEYEVKKEYSDCSLLEVTPKTGRTHQIRVHLAFIGHPIIADRLYGKNEKNEKLRLHCGKMSFFHPATNKEIIISSPIPDYFTDEY